MGLNPALKMLLPLRMPCKILHAESAARPHPGCKADMPMSGNVVDGGAMAPRIYVSVPEGRPPPVSRPLCACGAQAARLELRVASCLHRLPHVAVCLLGISDVEVTAKARLDPCCGLHFVDFHTCSELCRADRI